MGQLSESLERVARELMELQGSIPREPGYEGLVERLNELVGAVLDLSRQTRTGVLVGGKRMSWELLARIAADHGKSQKKKPRRPTKGRRTRGSPSCEPGKAEGSSEGQGGGAG